MNTFTKVVSVVADLVIVVAVIGFVGALDAGYRAIDTPGAAGLIVFSFVVKGWVKQYASKVSEEPKDVGSEGMSPQGSAVVIAVGVILISTIAFNTMDKTDDAMSKADDAVSKVEYLEYRVEDLDR
jgi:hypothetical protein